MSDNFTDTFYPTVLHVNVRLSEGGAATIARDLHDQLIRKGWHSEFAYGYGKGGKKSVLQDSIKNAFPIAAKSTAAINYGVHSVFGVDLAVDNKGRSALEAALDRADIIHLHAIHSYFLSYRWLLQKLIELRKPIVWTMHDMWILTGRCAYYSDCRKWLRNCGGCPDLKNYPSSFFDLSRREASKKEQLIGELAPYLTHVAVSRFFAEHLKQKYSTHRVMQISNSLERNFEGFLRQTKPAEENTEFGVLIIASDLSDTKKQDIPFLAEIIESNADKKFFTVGKHSPFQQKNVENLGPIYERKRLADVYSNSDVLLFTSEIDSFGIVMVEALCAGTAVLALESPGANELLSTLKIETNSRDQIKLKIKLAGKNTLEERISLKQKALELFGSKTMFEKYFSLYKSLLAGYE